MHVDIGHAWHDRAAALVDDHCAGGSREAAVDARDPSVLDDHRRIAALRLRRIDDQVPGLDGVGLGVGSGRNRPARPRRRAKL